MKGPEDQGQTDNEGFHARLQIIEAVCGLVDWSDSD